MTLSLKKAKNKNKQTNKKQNKKTPLGPIEATSCMYYRVELNFADEICYI